MAPVGHRVVEDTKANGIGSSQFQNFVVSLPSVQFAPEFYDPVSVGIPPECLDVGSAAVGLAQQILRQ